MYLLAENIKIPHAFSDRYGGFSLAPFNSLNFGGNDDVYLIRKNREHFMNSLSLKDRQLSLLRQVHGNKVVEASEHIQEADAQVSNDRSKVLVISVADCYPVLFHDPVNHVVGAAHAGWRGTVAYIVSETIQAMMKLGASPDNIQVAIGQGICKEKFEVGDEVVEMFKKAGFPASVFFGQRNIDLIEANRFALLQSGIEPQNIWIMNRCTYDEDFFSYRRDKGQTGRMWAVIALD